MHAPPIDQRSYGDIVAWTELLARCERAVPGPGLVGAVLDRDLLDPGKSVAHVVAAAGTSVDTDLAKEIDGLAWVDVPGLLAGQALTADIVNPANHDVYKAGTVVDEDLARALADLARIVGPEVLVGCTIGQRVVDLADDQFVYQPGTVVDARLAGALDRLAWVRIRSWRPRPDGTPDAGRALISIAGRLAALVVERVNRVPEQHEIAFLNLTGAQPLPPRPARVPLTFGLAASSPVDGVVAAGTQVTASPQEGEEDEVLFETDRSLVVTRAQLEGVFVGDAETDRYSDRTDRATGQVDLPFPAFDGDRPTPHQLFVACDPLLTQPGTKDVTVTLRSNQTWQWSNWPISWAYWDGTAWRTIPHTPSLVAGTWRVVLPGLPELLPNAVGGRVAGWLRAQLDMPLPPGRSGLVPESVASGNRLPQDLELPLAPFGETSPVKFFYMSADEAIGDGRGRVKFQFALARRGAGTNMKLNWTYRVGSEWRPLGQSAPTAVAGDFGFTDSTRALSRDGEVGFYAPPVWPRELYRNRLGRWLRVEVADDSPAYTTLPLVRALTVSSVWELPQVDGITVQLNAAPQAQAPPAGAFDSSPLDLSKDFFPFGEQPRFNDTFALALPENLARPAATVRLKVTLTNPAGTVTPKAVLGTGGARLAWEVWDGRTWRPAAVDDRTAAFTTSGDITVTLPETVPSREVNGVEGRWLRARLIAGHYGVAASYTPVVQQGVTTYVLQADTYAPPIVKTLTVEPVGQQQPQAAPSACVTYNDFVYVDQRGGSFAPFTTGAEPMPALYLGFDRPFDPRPVTLYLQVEPPLPEDVAADQLAVIDATTMAQVTWEYAGPDGWRPLGAVDGTQALAGRGLVTFVGPDDLTRRWCFGRSSYWLRVRWQRGYFPLPPRLRRVLLNTTWATQVVSVDGEILGSGTGNPDQVFTTAQAPVQPGQQVVVRERERPSPAEQAALAASEGADAVQVTQDAAGQPDEVWVRWHGVPDFYGSGARDRHYTVDPMTGEIRFGDGRHGMVPPVGQNNIRATYKTGGGEQGNRPAASIVQLTSGVPYVDSVTNHEPSQGGAPREPLDRLRARGPRALRHGDRAVTAQDLEDLAFAASTDVARAAAVAPQFDPSNLWLDPARGVTDDHRAAEAGRMGVIVVPHSDAARPTPSLGLLGEVQDYLAARCPPTADLWVAGPEWVGVTVTATVVPASLELADAAGIRAREALQRFLHPLTGGPHGQGWAFGRKPHRSDLFALLEGVDGVDHVQSLTVTHAPETQDANRLLALGRMLDQSLAAASGQPPAPDLQRWLDRALVYSGDHRITVALER